MLPNPSYNVKNFNKYNVLDLIRFSRRGNLEGEIARRLDLTRAAVTVIVDDLLASEIIRESERIVSQSGRPPVVLEIDPSRGYVVGIDFGASHISLLVADIGAHILDEIEIPLDIQAGPAAHSPNAPSSASLLRKTGRPHFFSSVSRIGN